MRSVHVWYLRTDRTPDALLAAWSPILSEEERERAGKFTFEKDRRAYLAAHGLLRVALSRYLRVPPGHLRFHNGPRGRPEIDGAAACSGLRFSLTHTDGLVACAVARGVDVGVDAEAVTRAAPPEVARRCFAPSEQRALLALPEGRRQEGFFEYWTLKEAFLKATGHGLTYAMEKVVFSLTPAASPRVEVPSDLGEPAEAWQFVSSRVEERFLIALALRSGGVERRVKIRSWRAAS